jgi:hypothetical protein
VLPVFFNFFSVMACVNMACSVYRVFLNLLLCLTVKLESFEQLLIAWNGEDAPDLHALYFALLLARLPCDAA